MLNQGQKGDLGLEGFANEIEISEARVINSACFRVNDGQQPPPSPNELDM